jgi:predicted unusual protein kinase regulating ubiquinone biosynthesis (AarF/ABC1/UbiB family)
MAYFWKENQMTRGTNKDNRDQQATTEYQEDRIKALTQRLKELEGSLVKLGQAIQEARPFIAAAFEEQDDCPTCAKAKQAFENIVAVTKE